MIFSFNDPDVARVEISYYFSRIEELEERQDCLEDKLNPNVSSNVSPNAAENVPDAPATAGDPAPPKER